MRDLAGVTLQINLAPTDLPHAVHTLPHQLRQWGHQVDEILLVVDLHKSRGKYSEGWSKRLPGLRRLIADCRAEYGHARCEDVDYSPSVARTLAQTYFGGRPLPTKDWNGAPFYSYFFGLHAANYDHVMHMDSDMMFGGGSPTWTDEAVVLLSERPDVFTCSPLPGPPTADGHLTSQSLERELLNSLAFRAGHLSTRVFMLDRRRFRTCIPQLSLTRPSRFRVWQALMDGNPPYDFAEAILSQAMAQRGLIRIDFLGSTPGMWSLHPPYRSALFYQRLPSLIAQVEAGEVPDAQRGDHDLNDSMVDWTGARHSFLQKIRKHERLLMSNVGERLRRYEVSRASRQRN
jgi:hypothetical protein